MKIKRTEFENTFIHKGMTSCHFNEDENGDKGCYAVIYKENMFYTLVERVGLVDLHRNDPT